MNESQDSSVGTVTLLQVRYFWGPPSLPFNVYEDLKFTTYFNFVPTLRMSGAIHLLPLYSSDRIIVTTALNF
jgi:hypothetical protein